MSFMILLWPLTKVLLILGWTWPTRLLTLHRYWTWFDILTSKMKGMKPTRTNVTQKPDYFYTSEQTPACRTWRKQSLWDTEMIVVYSPLSVLGFTVNGVMGSQGFLVSENYQWFWIYCVYQAGFLAWVGRIDKDSYLRTVSAWVRKEVGPALPYGFYNVAS